MRGDQLYIGLVVPALDLQRGDLNLLHQAALIGIHCVQAIDHVVRVDMGGGIAQRAEWVHRL